MAELLLVVEDVFTIPTRGVVLVPGLKIESIPPGIRPGDTAIELRRPDGSSVATKIRAIELPLMNPPDWLV